MDIKKYIASGIIETYVMGLCTREEEREMETLRRQYPELNEAVTRYEEEMERNMQQHITLPSPETDKKILDKLDSLEAPVIPITAVRNDKNRYGWLRAVAAAAVVLLAVSATFNYILLRKTQDQELALSKSQTAESPLPSRDYTILNDPEITPVAMYGVGIHSICRCTMFWDKKTGKMYVMIHHLVPSRDTKDYQLWATVDGEMVSIGILKDEIRGRFIEMENVPPGAVAFTVTLENAGGNNTPTLEETYLKGSI